MSSGPLPDRVDATKLFARSGRIDAVVSFSRLTRLQPYLAASDGQAVVEFRFGLDPEGRKRLTGVIQSELAVTCQRCMQPMPLAVKCNLDLLVFNDQTELEQQALQGLNALERDVLVLEELGDMPGAGPGEELNLVALVEDELILSLPLAPVHADGDCSSALNRFRTEQDKRELASADSKVSPFAVLAQLKQGKDGK